MTSSMRGLGLICILVGGSVATLILATGAERATEGMRPGSLMEELDTVPGVGVVTAYYTPGCSCCRSWIEHMREEGLETHERSVQDLMRVKRRAGIPPAGVSCHTAFVNGYVIEGHLPASMVRRLLKDRPTLSGLAAPGMPSGSPGMEGRRTDTFDVFAFDATGRSWPYAQVHGQTVTYLPERHNE